jgi:ubiquinone/menaquinone biosynthesis C-methylase UbiE
MPWWDSRWRKGFEGKGLTWGTEIDGRQVLEAFTNLGLSIKSNHVVLEVGPGYGRVFETFRGFFEFRKWYMVDINPDNCEFLIKKFGDDDRIKVLCQDVNQLELPEKFNLGISTLTFKHLYPDFSQALTRIARYIKDDGTFLFDLIPPGEDRLIHEGANIANIYSERSLRTH